MLGIKEYPYGVSAQFENCVGGGTAREVIALSEELSKSGFCIDLIVRRMPGQKKFEVCAGVNIYRVFWFNNRYLRLPSFNLFSFFCALKIIKKVDLIHSHSAFSFLPGLILSKIFKKKSIGTNHGGPWPENGTYASVAIKITRWLERLGLKNFKKFIFMSETEKENLCKGYNITPENYKIVNIGIKPLSVKRKVTDNFKVVFVGRLISRKGLDKFILSYKELPDHLKGKILFIIVGDGFQREQLEQLTRTNELQEYVHFTGFTSQIEKYLEDASLCILPSDGIEGLPSSMLEAMSVGIPCVISNFKAPVNDNCYIYLKDNEPVSIARAIEDAYFDRKKLALIGERAKKAFDERFSINVVAKNFQAVYRESYVE